MIQARERIHTRRRQVTSDGGKTPKKAGKNDRSDSHRGKRPVVENSTQVEYADPPERRMCMKK
ncbi:hypothetical protein [Rhizobium sp. RU33A]|uniref:hypothetical protein n=1 Tax=Rhizobium sp. RU33A TaxID=1907413 RepID=UPI001115522A|nr:hypothetical protein [Rhizobium sp. RU33A]